jgi:hypothetical protein
VLQGAGLVGVAGVVGVDCCGVVVSPCLSVVASLTIEFIAMVVEMGRRLCVGEAGWVWLLCWGASMVSTRFSWGVGVVLLSSGLFG